MSGRHNGIRYRQGETLLFGCLTLDEAAGDMPLDARTPLQVATQAAYESVFELLESRGYNAILRFWNYFPAINRSVTTWSVTSSSILAVRMRSFHMAAQSSSNVPAACALGSAGGGLQVAFLAARAEPLGIENPRQISAYHYPSPVRSPEPDLLPRVAGQPAGTRYAVHLRHCQYRRSSDPARGRCRRRKRGNVSTTSPPSSRRRTAKRRAPDSNSATLPIQVYIRHGRRLGRGYATN